jgi:paraquat-inducible protein B
MSRQANTKLIGGFVVSAVALITATVIIFGGGKFLSERKKFILFFGGSVKGLSIGSAVDFRGVRIGSVVDVNLVIDLDDESFKIPVVVEIEMNRLTFTAVGSQKPPVPEFKEGEGMEKLIQKGLRAQLGTQSFLTGQLYVGLDFHPDTPILLSGVKSDYMELPTMPSRFEQLRQKIEEIPLNEIAEKLRLTLDGMERFINSPEIDESKTYLRNALRSIDELAQNIDRQIKPLASNIKETSTQAKKLLANVDSHVKPAAADVKETARTLRELAVSSEQNLAPILINANSMIEEGSPLRYSLTKTLEDLASAARSLRNLADTLERNPETMLRGRSQKGEK